jgi:glycosyltransferase involved in cell wall biosynthesis
MCGVASGLRCDSALAFATYVADYGPIFSSPFHKDQSESFSGKHKLALRELASSEFPALARAYTALFVDDVATVARDEGRPCVGLIIDWDNWAYASISRQIIKHSSAEFHFIVIPSICITNPAQMLMMCKDCDLIHFYFRPYVDWLYGIYGNNYIKDLGCDPELFRQQFLESKVITTGIYDHLFLDDEHYDRMKFLLNDVFTAYYVSSNKLADIYRNLPGFRPPAEIISGGVDLNHFGPHNLERFDNASDRELVVGWVGNSQWRSDLEDMKGVQTILLPAIEQVNADGPVLRTHFLRSHFADRHTSYVPAEKMPYYYSEIDVLVCASKIEGTPTPVLEAMACGVPIVSTDVGIVPDVLGPLQKRFILEERSIEHMTSALRFLATNRHLLSELSRENLQSIQSWDWSIRVAPFKRFFANAMHSRLPRFMLPAEARD